MTTRLAFPSLLILLGGLAATPALSAMPPQGALGGEAPIIRVQAAGSTVTVRTSYANLRAEPTTKSTLLGRLKHGAKLEVVSTTNGWVQVKSGDKTGYVNAKLLTH